MKEWIELIKQAQSMGLSIEDIKNHFNIKEEKRA